MGVYGILKVRSEFVFDIEALEARRCGRSL